MVRDQCQSGCLCPYCFQNRYGVVQAGFVPFAFGGIYYFHQKMIAAWLVTSPWIVKSLLACAILAMFAGERLSATVGTYIGIPLTWTLLAAARDMRPTPAQDFFGRASYHLFISHMPIAAVLVTGLGFPVNGILVYVVTMAVALALSGFLVPMERRLNRTRQQIACSAGTRGVPTDKQQTPAAFCTENASGIVSPGFLGSEQALVGPQPAQTELRPSQALWACRRMSAPRPRLR